MVWQVREGSCGDGQRLSSNYSSLYLASHQNTAQNFMKEGAGRNKHHNEGDQLSMFLVPFKEQAHMGE